MTTKKNSLRPHGALRTFEAKGVVTYASIKNMSDADRSEYITGFMERSVEVMRDKAAEEKKTLVLDTVESHYEVDPEGNHHFRLTARAKGKHRDRRSGRA